MIIDLNKVSIFYKENLVLEDIDFMVDKKEFIYLIGKTGTGKSSLLKAIYGEINLQDGTGEVCGYNLNSLKKSEIPYLRRKIGIVFQDFQLLFDRTVYENLEFVLRATDWNSKSKIDARIKEVLKLVSLSNKINSKPHQLSGGEQQRLAIARSILNEPELILADEPTANLDPETSAEIIELLIQINKKGVALIIATHDYRIIENYPSIVYICNNKKLEKLKF